MALVSNLATEWMTKKRGWILNTDKKFFSTPKCPE
jgi:hypothetical protein